MVVAIGDPRADELLIRTLASGGIAIMPCDTIYGIVGRAPESEARIRAAKGRGESAPFLLLIESTSALGRLSESALDPRVARLWPGPLTVVVPAREGGTIAVRVPADRRLRSLIARLGFPLYSTSVNTSGQPALGSVGEIVTQFEGEVDLIVEGGDLVGRLPSTLLDVTARPYRILRQGACRIPPSLLT